MLALRIVASWIVPELCLRIKPQITKKHRRSRREGSQESQPGPSLLLN